MQRPMELGIRLGEGRALAMDMRHLDIALLFCTFLTTMQASRVPTRKEPHWGVCPKNAKPSNHLTLQCNRDVTNSAVSILLPNFHSIVTTPFLSGDKVIDVCGALMEGRPSDYHEVAQRRWRPRDLGTRSSLGIGVNFWEII